MRGSMTPAGETTVAWRLAVWSAAAAAVALAAAAVSVGLRADSVAAVGVKPLAVPLLFAVPGAVIALRGRRMLGSALLGVALLFALSALAVALLGGGMRAAAPWWIWYADRASALIVPLTLLLLLLLPDGRLPSRRWTGVVAAAVGVQVLTVAVWSLLDGPAAAPDTSLPEWTRQVDNPVGVLPETWGPTLTAGADVLLQLPFVLVLLSVASRLRSARGDGRRRTVDVLLAVVCFVLLVVIGRQVWPAGADLLDVAGGALLAATVTASALRLRLGRLEWLVGRATVFLTLAVALGLGYALVVSLVEGAGARMSPLAVGLVAAAVTLALTPARARLQDAVDWAMYGDSRESARVRALTAELAASRQRLVTAREEERATLRRRLHDDVGPTLAGLAMQLRDLPSVLAADPVLAAARLERLGLAAEGALDEVRTVSRDLRPPALDELGLVGALVEAGEGQSLSVAVTAEQLPTLPAGVEAAAYRIGREALTNVARHAGCAQAELVLRGEGHGVRLEVRDRGRGRLGPAGVGLVSMRERAAELGGWVRVEDTDGGGTSVLAWLPLAPGGAA